MGMADFEMCLSPSEVWSSVNYFEIALLSVDSKNNHKEHVYVSCETIVVIDVFKTRIETLMSLPSSRSAS